MKHGAQRVVRGWSAALICTWTAFASHAHAAPTAVSLTVFALVTCVSAVIAMALLGRKYSLLGTAVVVAASQGLYHWALSMMTGGNALAPSGEHELHAHAKRLIVLGQSGEPQGSMLYAHALGALVSLLVLRWGERALGGLRAVMGLRRPRWLLALLRKLAPLQVGTPLPCSAPTLILRSQIELLLQPLRGPPRIVFSPLH